MSEGSQVLKIEWESDEELHFPLTAHLVVNFDDEHFYVRFYQVSPPLGLNETRTDVVKAKLVAGVAIPASKMSAVIEALAENHAKYRMRLGQVDDFGAAE